jgi:hypothetical protein
MTGGAGAAAAAAAAKRRRRRFKIISEGFLMTEPITCPVCGKGKLLPLISERSTNWACSQPECSYVIHQHGSDNKKIWKGQAQKEQPTATSGWLETP